MAVWWLWVACHGNTKTGTGDTASSPEPTDSGTHETGTTHDTHTTDTHTPGPYHPDGWADPAAHGLTTKLQNGHDDQDLDCRGCHGADLEGVGVVPACSSCHVPDWKTTCTFCHGDAADGTGSPPRDIDNETAVERLSFPQHRIHVDEGTIHADYDCSMCHAKPTDALTEGHVFDDGTPQHAEVAFLGGSYDQATQTCTVYCHGDGTGRTGDITVTDGPLGCSSCHRSAPTTGHHAFHLGFAACNECHGDVNQQANAIIDPAPHVDGAPTLFFSTSDMAFDTATGTCSGTCHYEVHAGRRW